MGPERESVMLRDAAAGSPKRDRERDDIWNADEVGEDSQIGDLAPWCCGESCMSKAGQRIPVQVRHQKSDPGNGWKRQRRDPEAAKKIHVVERLADKSVCEPVDQQSGPEECCV